MPKQLPKTIYVQWEAESDRPGAESFLVATENWEQHAELATRQTVGTYQLVEVSDVVSETRKLPRKAGRAAR